MKPKNEQEIAKGYKYFSLYLVSNVIIGVLVLFFYNRTALVEITRIENKTSEYDEIYVKQIALVDKMDSLYYYINLFNTNLNDLGLQEAVSRRKQEIIKSMEGMNKEDILLTNKLTAQMNSFLQTKDSIRIQRIQEDLVRNDLSKSVSDNKIISRKLTLSSGTRN